MRLRIVPLLAVLAALAAAAAPAPAAEIGLNVNGGAAAGADYQNFEDLSELRSGWARHFLDWDNFDYDNYQAGYALYQQMLDEEARRGVKTLITIKSAGNTPPEPEAFARRAAQIARTLKGVEAIEVWNEADESMFWAGGPNAEGYVAVLKAAYPAIKSASPSTAVVFSPTVGNNYDFLAAAYRAGAQGSFDAMAVHTDTACLDRPPSYFYREQDGRLGRFTFLGYREVHRVMQANGDGDKPIWMTEFGWSAAQHTCELGASAGQKPAGVGEQDQAAYLLAAMSCLEQDPFVTVALWYTNRDLSGDGKMENAYGLRRFDGSTRPAFEAFRTWTSGGGRSGEPCGDFEGPAVEVLEPTPGFVLAPGSNLTVRARSTASDLNRIWFRVEGPGAAPLFGDGPISLPDEGGVGVREWGGARDLQDGAHRLLVWATDRNDNPGPVVEVAFTRGAPAAAVGQSLVQFPRLRLAGRGLRRTFSGGSIPGITSGAVRVEWQLKRGPRWRRYHGKTVVARRPFRVTQRLRRHGTWRVRAVYLGRPGIPRRASCWTVFNSRSTRTRLSCPPGAVRPTRRR